MLYLPISLLIFVLTLLIPMPGTASTPDISSTIDRFVSKLYPKGSHYFWVINNATSESSQEMIIDINTTLKSHSGSDKTEDESRFLLLIVQGSLFAAQKIPLDANVDCSSDEEV